MFWDVCWGLWHANLAKADKYICKTWAASGFLFATFTAARSSLRKSMLRKQVQMSCRSSPTPETRECFHSALASGFSFAQLTRQAWRVFAVLLPPSQLHLPSALEGGVGSLCWPYLHRSSLLQQHAGHLPEMPFQESPKWEHEFRSYFSHRTGLAVLQCSQEG